MTENVCSGPLPDQIRRGGMGLGGAVTDPNLRDGGRQVKKVFYGDGSIWPYKRKKLKIACMPYLSAQKIIGF